MLSPHKLQRASAGTRSMGIGIGALPGDPNTMLQAGSVYTFVLGLSDGLFSKVELPSANSLLSFLQQNVDPEAYTTTLNVTSAFLSSSYNIQVRMLQTIPYSAMVSIIKNFINANLGWNVSEVDFIPGQASASLLTELTSPLTSAASGAAGTVTSSLSSLKWLAIAGVAGYALFMFGPLAKRGRR